MASSQSNPLNDLSWKTVLVALGIVFLYFFVLPLTNPATIIASTIVIVAVLTLVYRKSLATPSAQKILVSVLAIPFSLWLYDVVSNNGESVCLKRGKDPDFCGGPQRITADIHNVLIIIGIILPVAFLSYKLVTYSFSKNRIVGIVTVIGLMFLWLVGWIWFGINFSREPRGYTW